MFAGSVASRNHLRSRRSHTARAIALTLLTALIPILGCGSDIESRLAEVRSLHEAGQYDASIAPLRKILAGESRHPEANYRLGIALLQTGRQNLAIWSLQKASETDEYGIQAGILLASTLYQNGTFEEAVRAANRVLALEPDNLPSLYTRANSELAAGHPEKTLEDADHLLRVRPDDSTATALRGAALIDLDRGEEAERTFSELAAKAAAGEDSAAAARTCAALASFYQSQKDDEKGEETFEKCIAKYPTHGMLQQRASDFFVSIGKPGKAIKVWRNAVDETPEDLSLRSKLADLLYGQGQAEEAEELLKESVELFDTPPAWRMLASFHRKSGDPKKARQALEEAMERTRSVSPPLRFALADMLIEEGDLERAEEVAANLQEPSYRHLLRGAILLAQDDAKGALEKLEAGLRLWPNNAGARYMAGKAAQSLGDRERALAEYREAVRVGESETDAALRMAEIHYSLGQYKPALQFAERHIRKRPYVEPSAHIIAARSAAAIRQYERAQRTLENLKAKDPTNSVALVEFTAIERKSKGPEAALVFLAKSKLDLTDPANIEALRGAVGDHLSLGQNEKANELLAAATSAHADSAPLLDLRARVMLRQGKQEQARELLTKALEANAEFGPALETLGGIQRVSGDLDGALALFERAAKSEPENAEYIYLGAQTLTMKGENEEAIERLGETLEVDPGHAQANNDLAWLLASTGRDLERALKLALIAVRVKRGADTLDTLGYVHLRKGDTDEAVSTLSKALEERPNSPSIEYRLGVALAAKGEKEEARAILTKALETQSFPEAEAARAELEKLQDS